MKNLTATQLAVATAAALIIATGSTPAQTDQRPGQQQPQTPTTRQPLLLTIKLDCGTLDGAGRVMVLIDRQVVELADIACTRTPA